MCFYDCHDTSLFYFTIIATRFADLIHAQTDQLHSEGKGKHYKASYDSFNAVA